MKVLKNVLISLIIILSIVFVTAFIPKCIQKKLINNNDINEAVFDIRQKYIDEIFTSENSNNISESRKSDILNLNNDILNDVTGKFNSFWKIITLMGITIGLMSIIIGILTNKFLKNKIISISLIIAGVIDIIIYILNYYSNIINV